MTQTSDTTAQAIHNALQKAMDGGLVTSQDFEKFAVAHTHAVQTPSVPLAEGFGPVKCTAKG